MDDKKIYGTGYVQQDIPASTREYILTLNRMSNGGGFIGTIACSAVGGKFAALAAGSGSFYTDVNGPPCQPARSPLPLLEIHGGNDKSVPYNGGTGEGGALPSITSW